jgi:predicted DNA-binding protein YlxM (UPF0122 family)
LAKPRGPEPRYDKDQALALLRFGATNKEVAETFGVSRQAISALAKREGVMA